MSPPHLFALLPQSLLAVRPVTEKLVARKLSGRHVLLVKGAQPSDLPTPMAQIISRGPYPNYHKSLLLYTFFSSMAQISVLVNPQGRSMVEADAEYQLAQLIKVRENPAQISLRLRVHC